MYKIIDIKFVLFFSIFNNLTIENEKNDRIYKSPQGYGNNSISSDDCRGLFFFQELLPEEEQKANYEVARVEKGNIETLISATSQVGDTDQVDIISSVSGEAIKVAVSEGQEVKKGDLIVSNRCF